MEYQVKPDPQSEALLRSTLAGGRRGAINRALQAAVSRTVTTGVAQIARRIGQEVRLTITAIKESISSSRGSYDDPRGRIVIRKDKTFWLANYLSRRQQDSAADRLTAAKEGRGLYARVTPKGGVTVRVRKRPTAKYQTTETYPHAFIQQLNGHIGIFQRTGLKRVMSSGRFKGKVREVIRRMRGPTPIGVFQNAHGEEGSKTILQETVKFLGNVLRKNILSQVSRFFRGRGSTPVSGSES